MDSQVLRVTLAGGFALSAGLDSIPVKSGRQRSLLAWLALHASALQPRERVAAALWPDSPDPQARTNLRNLLHQVRRSFPSIDPYLDVSGPDIGWRMSAPIEIDVVAMEEAVHGFDARNATAVDAAHLEEMLEKCASPLLPHMHDEWVANERDRVRRVQEQGLEMLLEYDLEHGRHVRVLKTSDRILDRDPFSEKAYRARIVALAARGDRASAVHAYHECESVLAKELGVAPDAATTAAYRSALSDGRGDSAPASATGPQGRTSSRVGEHGIVGRAHEQQVLRDAWTTALDSDSRIVLVTGEPGIGKTRLVQSLIEFVSGQENTAVQARAYPTLGALAYGPIITWLRSPRFAAAVAEASRDVRAELHRLLPELQGDVAGASGDDYTEAERRQRIHDAILSVLTDTPEISLLVIDDLQWADRETVDLVNTLVLESAPPLLVVATVRTGEVEPGSPLERIEASLRAASRLDSLDLAPLTIEETAALARQIATSQVTEEEALALYRETEGNPLFIVESVRSGLEWMESGGVMRIADRSASRIRAVVEARLSLLSQEARATVQIAAVLGREFPLSVLLAVSTLDETATLRGLDEAWHRRLIRERGDGTYDFSHGKIREIAYRTTSPIRRREYHRRVAGIFEELWAGSTRAPQSTLDQIAMHYDLGGAADRAVEWYRRAAMAAMDVSALDAVKQLLSRALELLERLPAGPARDEAELEMRLRYGSVLVALEGYGRTRTVQTYERARELCALLGRPATAPILRALALAAIAKGDLDQGVELGNEISALAERDDDAVARVEGAYVSGVMAFWRGDLAESERRLTQAIEWYDPARHREHVRLYAQDPQVVCLSRLSWTLWHRGRVRRAVARRDKALSLADRSGDPLGLAYTLWFTLFIALDQGDVARIEAQTRRMKRIAVERHLPYIESVADGFQGYLDCVRGEARSGIARMREVIGDVRWAGMEYVLKSQMMYLLARSFAGMNEAEAARRTIADGLDYLGPGDSFWKGPLLYLDAQLIGREDRAGERALPAFRCALDTARALGSAWIELSVAIDQARWALERGPARSRARGDLQRALAAYGTSSTITPVAAARVLLEQLDRTES